jgi:hypothetical protein
MHVQSFREIEAVDPLVWDHLTAQYPYAGWEWCRYGEAVSGREAYYTILSAGDEPIKWCGGMVSVSPTPVTGAAKIGQSISQTGSPFRIRST